MLDYMNTKILYRIALTAAAGSISLIPLLTFAQTVPTTQPTLNVQASTTSSFQQSLLAEIATLEQQLMQIHQSSTTPAVSSSTDPFSPMGIGGDSMPHICLAIARNLTQGSRGADVTQLQEMLTQYPSIYPQASVTGYFGPATAAAIGKLQIQLGVASSSTATGYVGPLTRSALKSGCGTGGTEQPGPVTVILNSMSSTTPLFGILSPLHPPIIASTTLQARSSISAPTQAQGQINAAVPVVTSSNQPSSMQITAHSSTGI
jgi:hypothetical protein